MQKQQTINPFDKLRVDSEQSRTIKCVFCKGSGKHPYFAGACPVCKGRGKNQIVSKYMTCRDCRGSGQKRGTTLTCYTCGGLGVISDMREEIKKARKEIKKARGEIEKEIGELRVKSPTEDEEDSTEGNDRNTRFCQCCANKIDTDSAIKVCLACFRKIKGGAETITR